ncbi:outer membrane lipoprotein-sorting protein [bacterium]|nr:outer membrane lipoprotein-sorting protein [bacterium]
MRSRIPYMRILPIIGILVLILSVPSVAITSDELKAKVQAATNGLKDISMLGTVTQSNKDAIAKIDENYTRLYEFKSARVMLKLPDKMRMEGKLGMVKFEYIINGGIKIFRASPVRINKRSDYSDDPAKLQSALDVGLITSTLWDNRKVEIVEDAEAKANCEIKLQLKWPKGDMQTFIWIDKNDLWLKKLEKRDGQGDLKVRVVYSNPKNIDGIIWLPTKAEMYSSSGDKVGTTEMSDIKYNSGLPDSLFE